MALSLVLVDRHWERLGFFLFLLIFLLSGCGGNRAAGPISTPLPTATQIVVIERTSPTATAPAGGRLAPPVSREEMLTRVPALAARATRTAAAFAMEPPIVTLDEQTLETEQARAQALALASADFVQFSRSLTDGQPLRSEVMAVYPARPSDVTDATQACATNSCYRVELYNYALNQTSTATVDLGQEVVLAVDHLRGVQPELSEALAELALEIALTAPEVVAELGTQPTEAIMANTKTALNNSACENSEHLCVAPTFVLGDRALWAVVDLTDERLVGVRWTDVGDFSQGRPTEQLIQIEEIFEDYCQQENQLAQDDWQLDYILTASDGLRISEVTFQGAPVLDSAKIVDWHVRYSQTEGFGYSDAVGCPKFSSSAVVATSPPEVVDIVEQGETVGFALLQDYAHPLWPAPCNYRYQQRFEFYQDGRFRIVGVNLGRGCGNDGVYRPVMRIDLAEPADGGQTFAEWTGETWDEWMVEDWRQQTDATVYTPEGYQFRITATDDPGTGYYLEPGQGQWDEERGDNAYVYVSLAKDAEGASELMTLGSCCNEGFRQGPDQFIDEPPESIVGEEIVIWYVPQIENDDTPGSEYCWANLTVVDGLFDADVWPCAAGPMFVPIGNE